MIVSQGDIYHHESLVKAIKQVDVVISALGSLSSHVMLVLYNVRMVPLNMRKIKEPPNVTKVQSYVMLVLYNVRMVPSNVRKNKRTIKCDKSTVICDVSTVLVT